RHTVGAQSCGIAVSWVASIWRLVQFSGLNRRRVFNRRRTAVRRDEPKRQWIESCRWFEQTEKNPVATQKRRPFGWAFGCWQNSNGAGAFDPQIGSDGLTPHVAIYADLSDEPDPVPFE